MPAPRPGSALGGILGPGVGARAALALLAVAFVLLLALPGQLQLLLELLDPAAVLVVGVVGAGRLFGLVLAQELAAQPAVALALGPLALLGQAGLGLLLLLLAPLFGEPPLALLLFPPPALLVGLAPLLCAQPPRLLLPPPALLVAPHALVLGLALRLPPALLLLHLLALALLLGLFLFPQALLVGQRRDARTRTSDLPPPAERYAEVALAGAAHVAVLGDVPRRRRRALELLLAPAANRGGALGRAPTARAGIARLACRQGGAGCRRCCCCCCCW